MYNSITETVKLLNGVEMPVFGYGTWMSEDEEELIRSIKYAVDECGYIAIDTAPQYGNEKAVGAGIRACHKDRKELFITSKLLNYNQLFRGANGMIAGFYDSLDDLGLDYLDLWLMHWPLNEGKKFIEAWKAMVEVYKSGKVRAIGVCNCEPHNIEDMFNATGVMPMVNQCECHPSLQQDVLRAYCKEKGIVFESYSPLMHGELATMPDVAEIGKKYDKTSAQVILRWHLQSGNVIIPKSVHENRILENSLIFDFELTEAEMAQIKALNKDKRCLPHPDLDITFSPPPDESPEE